MARETPATETAPAADSKATNKQVNGTISGDLFKALDEYRWTVRIDRMPKLVAKALEEYAINHGLMTADGEVIPQESK